MKKIILISTVIFFTLIYIVSSNVRLMGIIAPYRYELESPLGSDKYKYGDLYGFSYLKDFKIKPEKKKLTVNSNKPRSINLYALCDSYLWSFVKSDSLLEYVNRYKYARLGYGEQIEETLDTNFTNILIIEVTERQVRKYLSDTKELFLSMRVSKDHPERLEQRGKGSIWKLIERNLFNDDINQNLEFNLFEYSLLTPVKEFKASLFFNLFGRVNKDVSVSSDKKYLFYGPTTDNFSGTSSFSNVSDEEVFKIISTINIAYYHYKELGFDEIYLSIIPNPISILEPGYGNYNHLLERIQNNKDLKMPYINVYPQFKETKSELYYRSDTHWNYNGLEIWLNETNKTLQKYSQK